MPLGGHDPSISWGQTPFDTRCSLTTTLGSMIHGPRDEMESNSFRDPSDLQMDHLQRNGWSQNQGFEDRTTPKQSPTMPNWVRVRCGLLLFSTCLWTLLSSSLDFPHFIARLPRCPCFTLAPPGPGEALQCGGRSKELGLLSTCLQDRGHGGAVGVPPGAAQAAGEDSLAVKA